MAPYTALYNNNMAGFPTKDKKDTSGEKAQSQAQDLENAPDLNAVLRDMDHIDWPVDLLRYNLSAVIVHKGELSTGHYVNYAREGRDWFLFDDSKVILVNESEVLGAEAYILLYVIDDFSQWAPTEEQNTTS